MRLKQFFFFAPHGQGFLGPNLHGRGLLRVYAKELKVELPELEKKQNSVETLSLNQKSKENSFTVETSKNDIVTPSLHDILGIDVAQKKEKGPEHKPVEKRVPKEKALYPKKPKREITNTTQKIIAPNPLEENAQGNTKTLVKKDQKSISPLREIGKNCLLLLGEIKDTLLKNKRRKLSLAIFLALACLVIAFFTLRSLIIKKDSDLDIVSLPISQNKTREDSGDHDTLSQSSNMVNNTIGDPHETLEESEDRKIKDPDLTLNNDDKDSQLNKDSLEEQTKRYSSSIIAAPEKILEGAKEATLNISSSVEIRIIINGKQSYSGLTEAGVYNLVFNNKADLFIDDGSRVKLKYGDWDLGILGHEGRKRKIVLNARDNPNIED